MPPPLATEVERCLAGRFTPVPGAGSAAIEYTAVPLSTWQTTILATSPSLSASLCSWLGEAGQRQRE